MNSNLKTCYIVGAGECDGLSFKTNDGDIVIAADGGYDYLIEAGITPDISIGDFDSLGYVPDGVQTIKLPCVKDETDTIRALRYTYDMGYRQFVLFGCMGGALDHTVANLQFIGQMAKMGARCVLAGSGQCAAALSNGKASFPVESTGRLSVFALGGVAVGVRLSGFKYELENATLYPDFPLGVSNEFVPDRRGEISIKNGTLLLIWQGEYNDLIFGEKG